MKHCFALELNEDHVLIEEYEKCHQNVWIEIKDGIMVTCITEMEIYRTRNRLFMIMENDSSFSFDRKNALYAANIKIQEWGNLMWKFQKSLHGATEC